MSENISVTTPDIDKAFKEAVNRLEKNIGTPLTDYMTEVIRASKDDIVNRAGWSQSPGSIYAGMGFTVKNNEAEITNDAPHAYLRQWGETESGAVTIHRKDKKLFINKTGLTTEEFKSLSWQVIKERFQYGVDYFFANFVRIASNPYIAIPGISEDARNKIASYKEDSGSSEKAYNSFIESIFNMLNEILRSIGYDHRIQR